jgi:glycosyltransferase involved in cell wall biosynthesis
MPKILLIYQSKPDIVSGLTRGLQSKGLQVDCFLANQYHHWVDKYVFHVINKWAHNVRLLKKGKFWFTGHRLNHWNYLNHKLIEVYHDLKPDYVLFIHGIHYSKDVLEQITCPKIGWLVDPVTNPERLSLFATKLDWYFSYSQHAIEILNGLGYHKTTYLGHAVDHQQFRYQPTMLKTIDIAFVGKHSVHREQFILAALNITKKVSVYGSRWLAPAFSKPSLFFAIKGSKCYGKKLNALHNSSRIVLSIIAKPQSSNSVQSGINMRPYEILASGAMLLSDRYEELDFELIDGHNLVLFGSVEEFQSRLRDLLKNTGEIEQIAANGHKFIQNRFSYETMAEVILSKFKELSVQPK